MVSNGKCTLDKNGNNAGFQFRAANGYNVAKATAKEQEEYFDAWMKAFASNSDFLVPGNHGTNRNKHLRAEIERILGKPLNVDDHWFSGEYKRMMIAYKITANNALHNIRTLLAKAKIEPMPTLSSSSEEEKYSEINIHVDKPCTIKLAQRGKVTVVSAHADDGLGKVGFDVENGTKDMVLISY